MDILQEVVSQHLPHVITNSGKCLTINCPCCVYMGETRPDTRGRGGVFMEAFTTGYNCFNCGFRFRQNHDMPLTKNARKFLEFIDVPRDQIQRVMFLYRKNVSQSEALLDQFFNKKKDTKIDLDYESCKLPPNTSLLVDVINKIDDNTHPAFKAYMYAYERGIEKNPALLWSSSPEKNMKDYLIIPFLWNDQIVGYQARYTGDNEWYKQHRRFINVNPNTGKYVYGIEHVFSKQKYLFINESLIDSYLYKGVGVMSHTPTINQINIINRFKGKKILIPDFGKGGQSLIDVAMENEWSVYFPFWDDGRDLGEATEEYGRLFLTHDIIQNCTDRETTIRLKRKSLL